MQYLGLAGVIALLAVIVLLVALRLLLGGNWLSGWLRGTCGLLVLGFAGLVALAAHDVSSYQPLPSEAPLVTLSFAAQGEQLYEVRLQQGARERTAIIEGDLWQLDLNVLRWKSLAELIGLESGHRLERLSGRYLAIEQQQRARHERVLLAEGLLGVDIWQWLWFGQQQRMFFEAQPLRINYMPIADGAHFAVELTPGGLAARPLNASASKALEDW